MVRLDGNEVKMKHEESGNEIHVTFVYRGQLCNFSVIDHKSARNAAAYQGIVEDLRLVTASLEYACTVRKGITDETTINMFDRNSPTHIILSNIYISTVVLYAKCFTQADGRKVKLERSNLAKAYTEEQLTLHDKIMDIRNDWAAHGGTNDNESTSAIMVFDPTKETPPAIIYSASFRYIPEALFFDNFLELCPPLINLTQKSFDKSQQNYINTPFYGLLRFTFSKLCEIFNCSYAISGVRGSAFS